MEFNFDILKLKMATIFTYRHLFQLGCHFFLLFFDSLTTRGCFVRGSPGIFKKHTWEIRIVNQNAGKNCSNGGYEMSWEAF